MPYSLETWFCKKCGKRFHTYEEALDCKLSHITDKAVSNFRDKLRTIFPERTSHE